MEIVAVLTTICAFACSVCAIALWLRRQTVRHEARWARNHGPVNLESDSPKKPISSRKPMRAASRPVRLR